MGCPPSHQAPQHEVADVRIQTHQPSRVWCDGGVRLSALSLCVQSDTSPCAVWHDSLSQWRSRLGRCDGKKTLCLMISLSGCGIHTMLQLLSKISCTSNFCVVFNHIGIDSWVWRLPQNYWPFALRWITTHSINWYFLFSPFLFLTHSDYCYTPKLTCSRLHSSSIIFPDTPPRLCWRYTKCPQVFSCDFMMTNFHEHNSIWGISKLLCKRQHLKLDN